MSTIDLLAEAKARVEPALAEVLRRLNVARPEDGPEGAHAVPGRLAEAMAYALLSEGKRLRPALVLGAAHAVGAPLDDVLPAACAVEMIHAYSLVHDDLPIMDDDDERRGRPSTHVKFDEATALLVGDALLTEAFALVADGAPLGAGAQVPGERRAAATVELARGAGAAGMVGGQADDLAAELAETSGGATAPLPLVVSIHRRKTGRLIQAAAAMGAQYGGGSPEAVQALRRFGAGVGLAFQLVDDALDGDGVARLTSPDEARAQGAAETEAALAALDMFGPRAAPLIDLVRKMAERMK
ncbi:MAG: polyprenyl synthetase family protein [Deltaproteobacteria bacterium]|nr:polyprenyl synthetase family protein [Deltaproteobacteria bacterium]